MFSLFLKVLLYCSLVQLTVVTVQQGLQKNGPSLDFRGKNGLALCNFDCTNVSHTINESCVKIFYEGNGFALR